MKYEKKYKLLEDISVCGYITNYRNIVTFIVSTMDTDKYHYLVAGIGKPVHINDINPINKK